MTDRIEPDPHRLKMLKAIQCFLTGLQETKPTAAQRTKPAILPTRNQALNQLRADDQATRPSRTTKPPVARSAQAYARSAALSAAGGTNATSCDRRLS